MLQQFCHIFCSSAVGMLNVMWSTVCCLTLCGTMIALPLGCGCGDSMLWNACSGSGGRTQHAQQAGQSEGRGWGSRWGRGWGRASQTRCMAPDAGEAANDSDGDSDDGMLQIRAQLFMRASIQFLCCKLKCRLLIGGITQYV